MLAYNLRTNTLETLGSWRMEGDLDIREDGSQSFA